MDKLSVDTFQDAEQPLALYDVIAGASFEQHWQVEIQLNQSYIDYYAGRKIKSIECFGLIVNENPNFVVVPITKPIVTINYNGTNNKYIMSNDGMESSIVGITFSKSDTASIVFTVIARPVNTIPAVQTVINGRYIHSIRTIYE